MSGPKSSDYHVVSEAELRRQRLAAARDRHSRVLATVQQFQGVLSAAEATYGDLAITVPRANVSQASEAADWERASNTLTAGLDAAKRDSRRACGPPECGCCRPMPHTCQRSLPKSHAVPARPNRLRPGPGRRRKAGRRSRPSPRRCQGRRLRPLRDAGPWFCSGFRPAREAEDPRRNTAFGADRSGSPSPYRPE